MASYSDSRYAGIEDATKVVKNYSSLADLPLTNLNAGELAYVPTANVLYVTNGSGWYQLTTENA